MLLRWRKPQHRDLVTREYFLDYRRELSGEISVASKPSKRLRDRHRKNRIESLKKYRRDANSSYEDMRNLLNGDCSSGEDELEAMTQV